MVQVDWPTQLVRLLQGHLRIGKMLSPMVINSLVSVGIAKVKLTFIGKQNQIPVSTSEVQVMAAPILPCHSMMSSENLTEVRSLRTNRLNVLCKLISDCLWMNTILFWLLLQSDACYIGAARLYSDHWQQWSHMAYHFEDGQQRFLWQGIISINAR